MTQQESELFTIDKIIDYCKATQPDAWCTDVVRTKDGRNCLLGHIFQMGDDAGGEKFANKLVDWFEGCWANTFMFYSINDGTHPDYKQDNTRDRIVSYLEDLKTGKQKNINQLYDEY